ncbi:MAG: polymerase, sigma-24 subunit, subfamily [Rhodocyclales bacterium]|nr:polymerase, sigma-24 subunit, subfamily [Rhodocyclales bacterium]
MGRTRQKPDAMIPSKKILSDTTDDAELAARAATGETGAFELMMRRHNRLLFRTARSILKSDSDTQDALQDAYLNAWQALPRFRADAKLSTWLVRIVVNEALGRLRRRGAQVIPLDTSIAQEHTMEDPVESSAEQNPEEQPERMAMRAQTRRLIEARIDMLPDAFRTVFMLRAVEEMSVDEVAAALNIPEATVRSRFFRARGLLREGLSRDVDLAIDGAFSFAGERCDRIVANVMAKIFDARDFSDP